MATIGGIALVILAVFVSAELVWSRLRRRHVYDLRDSLSNVAMMIGNALIKPLSVAWAWFVLSRFEGLQPFRLPGTLWVFVLTFLAVDCAYYWYHRLSHEVPLLWTMHHTHHSSMKMNLTVAVRLNWVAKFVAPLFYAPLVLLGVSAEVVVASLALGLAFQFFLHTEAIGRLGWFEGWLLNTPSAHRVHHGSNSEYIDKNYGGALIIWDRLFGTYQREEAPVQYGVTTGFVSYNPFIVQLRPLWRFLRGDWEREKQIDARHRVERVPQRSDEPAAARSTARRGVQLLEGAGR